MKLQDMSNLQWQDLVTLVCGQYLGSGSSRQVYVFAPNPTYVIKLQVDTGTFQNQREWKVWQDFRYSDGQKWLAPIDYISDMGAWMLQKRTQPVTLAQLQRRLPRVPKYLTDLKVGNWGTYNGKIVCHDYGTAIHEVHAGTKVAKWWEGEG
jgi:hypothetical protein